MQAAAVILLLALCMPMGADATHPRNVGEVARLFTGTCSATTACTIQQPASGANHVRLLWAEIYASASLDITQERNGTAATTTAGTIVRVNPDKGDSPTATIFTASNVGVGTVIRPATTVPAGISHVTLEGGFLVGSGTAKNYTVRASSAAIITIAWEEYN